MTDEELLRLSKEFESLLPVARVALSVELQKRVIEVPQDGEHNSGWVNVELPRRSNGILFPEMCPSCLRSEIASDVAFQSLSHSKFRFAYVRHDYLSVKIPHCDQCGRLLARRRKQTIVYLILDAVFSFGLGIWLGWYWLVTALLFIVLSLPAARIFPAVESVSVGDYDDQFIVFRFRNWRYAEAFKRINGISETDIAAERIVEFLMAHKRVSGAK
jgi:hypothetical protein